MEMKLRVLGGRRFNDSIEGKVYDFTKLRIEMPVPRKSENEWGNNVIEANVGDHKLADHYRAHFTFPGEFFVELEPTSKGFDVIGIRPVEQAKKAA